MTVETLAKNLLEKAYQNNFDIESEKQITRVLENIQESTKGGTFAENYQEFYQLLVTLSEKL